MHVIAPGLRFLSILLFFLLPWIALFNRCSLYQAHTSSHSRAAHFINTTQPRYIALCPTERRASFSEGEVILTLRVVAVVWDKLFATSKWNMSQLHTLWHLSHLASVPLPTVTQQNILCENTSSSLRSPSHLESIFVYCFYKWQAGWWANCLGRKQVSVLRTLRSLAILNQITYVRVPSWNPGGAGSGVSGGMEGQHRCIFVRLSTKMNSLSLIHAHLPWNNLLSKFYDNFNF